jgi:hypothetical protein
MVPGAFHLKLTHYQAAHPVDELQTPDGHGVGRAATHWPLTLHEGATVREPAAHDELPHLAPVVILQPLTPSQVPSWQVAGVVPQAESTRPEFFCVHPDPSLLQAWHAFEQALEQQIFAVPAALYTQDPAVQSLPAKHGAPGARRGRTSGGANGTSGGASGPPSLPTAPAEPSSPGFGATWASGGAGPGETGASTAVTGPPAPSDPAAASVNAGPGEPDASAAVVGPPAPSAPPDVGPSSAPPGPSVPDDLGPSTPPTVPSVGPWPSTLTRPSVPPSPAGTQRRSAVHTNPGRHGCLSSGAQMFQSRFRPQARPIVTGRTSASTPVCTIRCLLMFGVVGYELSKLRRRLTEEGAGVNRRWIGRVMGSVQGKLALLVTDGDPGAVCSHPTPR